MNNQAIIRGCVSMIITAVVAASAIGFQSQSANYLKGVVTQSKKPLRSVWVIASQTGQERGRYLTGDDGKFYLGNLPAGECEIAVWQGKTQIYSGRISLPGSNIFNITITPKAPVVRSRTKR